MTDPNLLDLQHQIADVDAPPAPYDSVLRQGRQLRRRRRATIGVSGLAVTAIVVGGGVVGTQLFDGPDQDPRGGRDSAASSLTYDPVYAAGSTVVIGKVETEVPHTVHDMVFTSAGVLVRSNQNGGASDGSGPETLTLVRDDGSTTDLGVIPEGVGPATDPNQPYYALAEKTGTGFEAVIRDVRSGDVVKRVALPDQPPSYWDAPPLSLHGDQVYVGFKNSTWSVNWRTGDATAVSDSEGGIPQVSAGKLVRHGDDEITVRDLESGKSVSFPAVQKGAYGDLSPDGRFLLVVGQGESPETFTLYDVDTGESRKLANTGNGWWWQWTPDGNALSVTEDKITVCSVGGGCSESDPLPGLKGELKPGGSRFES